MVVLVVLIDYKKGSHRLYWEDPKEGNRTKIKFTGVPFYIMGFKIFDCQHGKDRNASLKRKKKHQHEQDGDFTFKKNRFLAQPSEKANCPARLKLREVIAFPDYKIEKDSKHERSKASKRLREDMAKGNVTSERRIYIEFPTQKDHAHHLIGDGSGLSQPVDERIIRKIDQLVNVRVKDTLEMRRHLDVFVKNEIMSEDEIQPLPSNRRFYPKLSDIRSHMYRATMKHRFSKVDQENVAEKVLHWKASSPEDFFYFRPYGEAPAGHTDVEGDNKEDIQTLLFIPQTAWQRRLLQRYGNDICLLDATYKTTRYSLTFVFPCGAHKCRLPGSWIICSAK